MTEAEQQKFDNEINSVLTTLFEAAPIWGEINGRRVLTDPDQLRMLVHETSAYLGNITRSMLGNPLVALLGGSPEMLEIGWRVAVVAHYVSCPHPEEDAHAEEEETEDTARYEGESILWSQKSPFQD